MLSEFVIKDNAITWKGNGEELRVQAWGSDSIRVRASRNHRIVDNGWGLLPLDQVPLETDVQISVNQEGSQAVLINGNVTVTLTLREWYNAGAGTMESHCSLRFSDAVGKTLLEELPAGGSLCLKAREYHPVGGGSMSATASFVSSENERLYGMGEYQQDYMNLKGCTLELAHRNSQASIPFLVSSEGYGFLWNNPAIGSVTFARNRTQWQAQSTPQIDYWVTAGESPAAIMHHYADATGHPPVMPEWGLGFWQCKLRYWNQQQVLDIAHEFHRRKIPLDLIVIDFFHWPHMGDYRFEDEFWPDPKAMCKELHSLGIKVMVSVWPQVSLRSENYAVMHANNLLVTAEHGIDLGMMFVEPNQFYDATNPEARRFVWEQCKKNYADLGVDAFWLDEAEPEYGTYDFSNYRYYAGPNQVVGNIYPVAYNKGFYDGQLSDGRKGEIVNLTRCAWVGSQRYASLVWSGDVGSTFADFRHQIRCAIHMGMAGIPWFTTDMGGFHDGDIDSPDFKELLMRWCAFSCFSPVMRNHGNRSSRQAGGSNKEEIRAADGSWRLPSGAANEPWSYGEQVEGVFRKFIGIRETLRPYLRQLFQEAHEFGDPLIRGLFYEFPEDRAVDDIGDEYMFGPDLLVAPVTQEGARSRKVYLPGNASTRWTDLHTGEVLTGGREVEVSCPVDVIPLFARDGRDHGLSGMM